MNITDLHTEEFDLVLERGNFLSIQDSEQGMANLFFNSLFVDDVYNHQRGYWERENIFMSTVWFAVSQARNSDMVIFAVERAIEDLKGQLDCSVEYKVSKSFDKVSIYLKVFVDSKVFEQTYYV